MSGLKKQNYRPSITIYFNEDTDKDFIKQTYDDISNYIDGILDITIGRTKYRKTFRTPEQIKHSQNERNKRYLKKKRAEIRKHKYVGYIPKYVKEALSNLNKDVRLFIYKYKDTQCYLDGITPGVIKFKKVYIEPEFAKFLAKSKHTNHILSTNFYEEYSLTDDFIKNYKSYFFWRKYSIKMSEQMKYKRKHGITMPSWERENREKYGCLKPKQLEELLNQENNKQ